MKFNYYILWFIFLWISNAVCSSDINDRRFPDLYSLDEYDSCVENSKGVYCVARFELYAPEANDLYLTMKEHAKDTAKHYNYSKIDRGVCVTRSCEKHLIDIEADLHQTLEECVNQTVWEKYNLNAKLAFVYHCDTHNDIIVQIDALDWTALGLLLTLVIFCLVGSYHDVKVRKTISSKQITTGNKYLLSFSVFQNWRSLMAQDPEDARLVPLRGLHGLRTAIIIITIFAHMKLVVTAGFIQDPETFEKTYDSAVHYLIYNGMMVVQVFFFLSGFIMAYLLNIQAETRSVGWSLVPKILVHRWFRLTPVCAAMILFTASWWRHLGSGPLWKITSINGTAAGCRTYWWSHLLYINNLIPDNKYCLFTSWHIAADTQMFILGVVAHVATGRRRNLVLTVLLLLGMLAPAAHTWLYDTDALVMMTPELLRHMMGDTYYYMHNRGYMNLPCFLIGMMTGYLGYNLQKNGVHFSKSIVLRSLSWLMVPAFMGVIYSGRMFFNPEVQASLPTRMVFAATHRAVLGLIIAAWVLGLICRCNDVSNILFRWRGWVVASKLSYCVYLLHIIFFHYLFGVRRELILFSYWDVTKITVGVLIASYVIAVPMYLVIEAPVNRLVKAVMVEERRTEKKNI